MTVDIRNVHRNPVELLNDKTACHRCRTIELIRRVTTQADCDSGNNKMYKRGRRWRHSNNKNSVQNSNQMPSENQVYMGVVLAVLVLFELWHLLV